MKVIVREAGGRTIRILFPSGVVFNRLSAAVLPGILEKNGITVTRAQATALVKALNQCRHRFRDWDLVEVCDSDGDYVLVKI